MIWALCSEHVSEIDELMKKQNRMIKDNELAQKMGRLPEHSVFKFMEVRAEINVLIGLIERQEPIVGKKLRGINFFSRHQIIYKTKNEIDAKKIRALGFKKIKGTINSYSAPNTNVRAVRILRHVGAIKVRKTQ